MVSTQMLHDPHFYSCFLLCLFDIKGSAHIHGDIGVGVCARLAAVAHKKETICVYVIPTWYKVANKFCDQFTWSHLTESS